MIILTIFALFAAAYSSTYPAAKAIYAGLQFQEGTIKKYDDDFLTLQREVQKHFLGYGIYIPIDDIILKRAKQHNKTYLSLLKKTCGVGSIYVWVPLKFRIPIIGEKVIEWCLLKKS